MSHFEERKKTIEKEMKAQGDFAEIDQGLYKRVMSWSADERKTQKRICKAEITEWTARNPTQISALVISVVSITVPLFVLFFNLSWELGKSLTYLQILAFLIIWLVLWLLVQVGIQSFQLQKKKRKLYYYSYLLACIEDVEKELGEQ